MVDWLEYNFAPIFKAVFSSLQNTQIFLLVRTVDNKSQSVDLARHTYTHTHGHTNIQLPALLRENAHPFDHLPPLSASCLTKRMTVSSSSMPPSAFVMIEVLAVSEAKPEIVTEIA